MSQLFKVNGRWVGVEEMRKLRASREGIILPDYDYEKIQGIKKKHKGKIADIIIPHHDRHDHLKNCLDRLPNDVFNIIIVSGGSFAQNCNKGARIAMTNNIIILNDDTLPIAEYLLEMCDMKEDVVGACQQIPGISNTYQGIGFYIENGVTKASLMHDKKDVHIPNGFLLRVKRDAWKKLGGFDEQFINGGEDSDFGLRALEAGFTIGYFDKPIIHKHSQSEGRLRYSKENQELLDKKWSPKKITDLIKLDKKPLRVLVANNHMKRRGGSETWTYTVAKELERIGHEVDVFTFEKGDYDLNFVDEFRQIYDLILINHHTCLEKLKDVKGFKIFTSHGIYHQLEEPKKGADAYVGISSEVVDHYDFNMEIINNGIDCEKFYPKNKINKQLKSVLSMCQGDEANKVVREACKKLGVKFKSIKQVKDVQSEINNADLVVTLGRGAYEAMACGRAVIVYDTRGYDPNKSADGIVYKENAEEILKNNFSGRRYKLEFTVDDMVAELKKYDQKMGDINRRFALENFNIKKQVEKYLELSKSKKKL